MNEKSDEGQDEWIQGEEDERMEESLNVQVLEESQVQNLQIKFLK